MRKISKICVILALFLPLLSGCHRQSPPDASQPIYRAVTAVTVTYKNGPIYAQRRYTSDEKMKRVMTYLRLLDPYGTPEENPEEAAGSDIHIILSYSDGFQKTYRQVGDRYMMEDGGKWQKIDPAKAEELGEILGQLESDEE